MPVRSLISGPGGLWVGTGQAFRDAPLDATLIVLHAYGQKQPWVLLTNTPVAETEPTLYACRNWIEQGFRGLKTVGWKWHKTRRRDPTRVGRHWLVLAMATLLAVAYGTRHEDAEARQRASAPAPGRVDGGPAECHSLLLLRNGCDLRPAPRGACAGRTPAAPESTRALGAGPASHSSIAHSTPRPLRSSAPRGPPHRQFRPTGPFCPRTAADSGPRRA